VLTSPEPVINRDEIRAQAAAIYPMIAHVHKRAEDDANDYLRRQKLTIRQLAVLRVLEKFGPVLASDLARRMLLSAPTISGIVARLERAGLIRRERDSGDLRKAPLELTGTGREKLSELSGRSVATAQVLERGLAHLDLEERAELVRLLAKFERAVKGAPAPG
jgi:DNA-binding MarR family transcriptional regulator